MITLSGFAIVAIYTIPILAIVFYMSKSYTGTPIRKYLIYAAAIKIIASQLIAMLYVLYYQGGDTTGYFNLSAIYTSNLFVETPGVSFAQKLLLSGEEFKVVARDNFYENPYGYHESSMAVIRLASYINLITGSSFQGTSMIFTLFCFSGAWVLYLTYIKLYPKLYRELAVSILFVPSVVFWGSGILKDTLCMGAIGWLFWSFTHLFFIKEGKSFFQYFIYILSIYISVKVLLVVKVYILAAMGAGLVIWLLISYVNKIRNKYIRRFSLPFIFMLAVAGVVFGLSFFSEELGAYALDSFIETAMALTYNLGNLQAGSAYSLGEIDGSISSILLIFPKAVNVTLFRPYLWEVRSVIMIFSAIESLLVFILFIYVFYKVRIFPSFALALGNGILVFSFIFSLIFAFAVGMSSGNFGTLVRYKIPMLPIFFSALFILYYLRFDRPFFESVFSRKKKKS